MNTFEDIYQGLVVVGEYFFSLLSNLILTISHHPILVTGLLFTITIPSLFVIFELIRSISDSSGEILENDLVNINRVRSVGLGKKRRKDLENFKQVKAQMQGHQYIQSIDYSRYNFIPVKDLRILIKKYKLSKKKSNKKPNQNGNKNGQKKDKNAGGSASSESSNTSKSSEASFDSTKSPPRYSDDYDRNKYSYLDIEVDD